MLPCIPDPNININILTLTLTHIPDPSINIVMNVLDSPLPSLWSVEPLWLCVCVCVCLCRGDPVHSAGWLPPLLGWGSAQTLPADQGWSVWCEDTHAHAHAYTHAHTHVNTHTHTHMHTYAQTCMHAYIHTCMHIIVAFLPRVEATIGVGWTTRNPKPK